MKNLVHTFTDPEHLTSFLSSSDVYSEAETAKSILVQIYSYKNDTILLNNIIDIITDKLPSAEVIGSTTVGEISEGQLRLGTIIISICFLGLTEIEVVKRSCVPGGEKLSGQDFMDNIIESHSNIAGVLLFATPITIDISQVFEGMSQSEFSFPVFGGGAGIYDQSDISTLFYGKDFISSGIIAVLFLGNDFHIYADSYLGWHPMSKEMTITESEGMVVKKVDNMNAFELYRRYLNIEDNDDFFMNVLEFPFLVDRDGYTVARVPFYNRKDGSIEFTGDIWQGEKFRIGYGDPDLIIQNSIALQKVMTDFEPEAIFIFACICRRFLMQNDVNLETQPFESIAPTTGFFTYGEFISKSNKIKFLNSTIVVVGMREGPKEHKAKTPSVISNDTGLSCLVNDPYSNKHNIIISRLLHFINTLTSELEESNKELIKISEIDKLTQIYNRTKLDAVIDAEIAKCGQTNSTFSVIILDVDNFKYINDAYGHLTGDQALAELSDILKKNIRETDVVGRWGGEEFLIILPDIDTYKAYLLTERIRSAIDLNIFHTIDHITCSFGIASYQDGDTNNKLILRADNALYEAKKSGKNLVKY